MIRLDLKREPHWLDLGRGARLHVRPCTTALMMAARADAQRAVTSSASDSEAAGIRSAALILAILDGDGVGDAAGNVAPVTPDSVDALMDLWPIASALLGAHGWNHERRHGDRGGRTDQGGCQQISWTAGMNVLCGSVISKGAGPPPR
jgi:hypothetical protein